ncbi:RDD family protein [Mariniluteicoccus flavus]
MSATEIEESWPGETLGLPETGQGSLASWRARIAAIVVDWAVCMVIATAVFGTGVIRGNDWRSFMILAVFWLESTVMSAVAGGSFGQLLARVAVVRLDREPLGFLRAAFRQAMVCLALPALVIGMHRRGLHDLVNGTVVVNRR